MGSIRLVKTCEKFLVNFSKISMAKDLLKLIARRIP